MIEKKETGIFWDRENNSLSLQGIGVDGMDPLVNIYINERIFVNTVEYVGDCIHRMADMMVETEKQRRDFEDSTDETTGDGR